MPETSVGFLAAAFCPGDAARAWRGAGACGNGAGAPANAGSGLPLPRRAWSSSLLSAGGIFAGNIVRFHLRCVACC